MSKELYWEKPSTKMELSSNIYNLESILNPKIISYLNSLLELESSIFKKEISNRDRKLISEFLIYKKVAIYNIYNKALNVIRNSGIDYKIINPARDSNCLMVSYKNETVDLFLFKFICLFETLPKATLTNLIKSEPENIGTIKLYQYYDDLDELEKRRNNYIYEIAKINKNLANRSSNYMGNDEYNKKIYKNLLTKLEERMKNGLPKETKEAIKILNDIHDLLLEDFDLTMDKFRECSEGVSYNTSVYDSPKLLVKNIKSYL